MFITPYRPQANGLYEHTNQTIKNILKTLIRDNKMQWDNDLAFALMAYRATSHSTTVFSPNILVYGRENSMPCDVMYGQTGAVYNRQPSCFCEYVDKLRTNIVAAYVRVHQTMGMAANRKRIYHDEDTATHFFTPADWVLNWNKPRSQQTLSSGWIGLHSHRLKFLIHLYLSER